MGKTALVLGIAMVLCSAGSSNAADSFPPIVASASSDIWDLRQVKVTFSEEVVGALDPFVYHMEEFLYPNPSIAVTNVAYGTSSNVVLLYLETSRNPEVPHELHITLHNIEDRFGNPLADPTIVYVPVPFAFQNGALGYIGTRDSTLGEITPNANRGDDPTVSCDDSPRTHGLLQFDAVFGYGPRQIPNCVSCITKATLHLFTTDAFPRGTPVRMLRMLVPWDEASTWNSLQNGIDQTNQVETGITDALIMGVQHARWTNRLCNACADRAK